MNKHNEDGTGIQVIEEDGSSVTYPVGSPEYEDILANETVDPWQTQEEEDIITSMLERISLLEAEKEAANIRDITPQEAKDWIDDQFASATTNAEVVLAVKKILKKIVVFLLR